MAEDEGKSGGAEHMRLGEVKTRPLRFVVAVDGSELSHHSFLTALRFVSKTDRIDVIHVADPTKEYLPLDMQPERLQLIYDTHLAPKLPPSRYSVEVVKKGKSEDTKEALCRWVNSKDDVDFFVVGMVGRKGPKLKPTLLGTTVDYSLRRAHTSSIIVKKKGVKNAMFLVGVDGSDRSEKAFQSAVRLAKAGDEILVVHIKDETNQDKLDSPYKATAVAKKYNDYAKRIESVTYRELPRKGGVADTICDLVSAATSG